MKGKLNGMSLTFFAKDDIFIDNSIYTGGTGYDVDGHPDGSGDPVNVGLVAWDFVYILDTAPRVLHINAALMAIKNNWRPTDASDSNDSDHSHKAVAGGIGIGGTDIGTGTLYRRQGD